MPASSTRKSRELSNSPPPPSNGNGASPAPGFMTRSRNDKSICLQTSLSLELHNDDLEWLVAEVLFFVRGRRAEADVAGLVFSHDLLAVGARDFEVLIGEVDD